MSHSHFRSINIEKRTLICHFQWCFNCIPASIIMCILNTVAQVWYRFEQTWNLLLQSNVFLIILLLQPFCLCTAYQHFSLTTSSEGSLPTVPGPLRVASKLPLVLNGDGLFWALEIARLAWELWLLYTSLGGGKCGRLVASGDVLRLLDWQQPLNSPKISVLSIWAYLESLKHVLNDNT